MKKLILLLLIAISLPFGEGQGGVFAQSREVPFTLDDRDRNMQTQIAITSLRNEMNTRFESQQKQIDNLDAKIDFKFDSLQQQINDLKSLFYWGFGIIITLIITLFGYIIYDRRTTLYPLLERTHQLAEKEKELERDVKDLKEYHKLKDAIKEYAQTDTKLAEILKRAAIL